MILGITKLNAQGYTTKIGQLFGKKSLYEILECYKGCLSTTSIPKGALMALAPEATRRLKRSFVFPIRYQRIKKLENNKKNNIEQSLKQPSNDTFEQKLADIESEIATVTAMQLRAEKARKLTYVTAEMVEKYIGCFKDYVLKRDKRQIRRMLPSYLDRVDVYKDKITVTFRIAVPDTQNQEVAISFERGADKDQLRTA